MIQWFSGITGSDSSTPTTFIYPTTYNSYVNLTTCAYGGLVTSNRKLGEVQIATITLNSVVIHYWNNTGYSEATKVSIITIGY